MLSKIQTCPPGYYQSANGPMVTIYIYMCIYQAHIHVLKVKSTITRFIPGISTSKNLFKEIESVNSNAPGRSAMLVG